MSRALVALALLTTACASREAPEAPPAAPQGEAASHSDSEPKDDAMPSTPDTAAPTTWAWRADGPEPATPHYLLGVVGQTGVAHCPGGGYERQWRHVHPTVGRVDVGVPDETVFDPLMDQPVLALGRPATAPRREVSAETAEPVEMCLPAQMRSDWRQTPRGIAIDRDPAPTLAYFEVAAVRVLHELQARLDGDHVVLTLRNPVPVALRDVALRVHYEGCFGKPGTMAKATEIGALAVGAMVSERVPQLTERPDAPRGRGSFRASSVQLVATGEGVVIDLDVPLRSLGAATECPR